MSKESKAGDIPQGTITKVDLQVYKQHESGAECYSISTDSNDWVEGTNWNSQWRDLLDLKHGWVF